MVKNKHKEQLAIGLFTGAVLAILTFIGTFAGNFLWEIIKIYPTVMWIAGIFFSLSFLILTSWFIKIAIKNLKNPSSTDYHKIREKIQK
ncbi:Uncharacterised protein [uncultured archaeon]|nr:Uncharacterised protein [uncultured archaeon]